MKVKPISPEELEKKKKEEIPSVVFLTVNKLLLKEWDGKEAKIYQEDIVNGILGKSEYSRQELFDEHLLDFEDAYREAGFDVTYDSPAYCESYEPFFVFKKKVKK